MPPAGPGPARQARRADPGPAAGFRHAVTLNDAGNEAMLGLNPWFGYQPVAGRRRYVRDLH
ncbi:hypothetical protein GCM10010429_39270 [Micromonospora olivasterospora]